MREYNVHRPGRIGLDRCVVALLVATWLGFVGPSPSQATPEEKTEEPSGGQLRVRYDKGLEIESDDGRLRFHVDWRAQLRYSSIESGEHPAAGDPAESSDALSISRARFKLGGHAYRRWLGYYLEYDLVGTRLLDLRFMIQPVPTVGLRVGQYKVIYNRERVDSSGKQQFVDRSIVTNTFTLDRQQGLNAEGRLFAGRRGDSRYAIGIFTGTGRGGGSDDDGAEPKPAPSIPVHLTGDSPSRRRARRPDSSRSLGLLLD